MGNNHILNNLSQAQREICMHDKGFALVLAGPGSGKTTVTVSRICRLATIYKQPQRILCQTFTVAAAREMENRYNINAVGSTSPCFSTIHSFCYKIIREHERKTGIKNTVLTENQSNAILQNIYKQINHQSAENIISFDLLSAISRSRNQLDTLSLQIKNFRIIADKYLEYKVKNNYIDYDDMILIAKNVLINNDKLRKSICGRYDYILLDEAQDMTEMQFDIIGLIAPHNNIFIVADDDQSIYGFRGAAPKHLMRFVDKFDNVRRYYLEQNYRSCKEIVNLACSVIKKNKERYDKTLFTENKHKGKVRILSFKDSIAQTQYVCADLSRQTGTCGILYRNNSSVLLIKAGLNINQINYTVSDNTVKTYQIHLINKYIEQVRTLYRNTGLVIPGMRRAFNIITQNGFDKYAQEYCEKTGQRRRYKEQIMSFLQFINSKCKSLEEIIRFLDLIDQNIEQASDDLYLSTIHGAKGLEYDNVYLIDMVQEEFPGHNNVSPGQLEEERRLFYVAITRARNNLTICYPQRRYDTKQTPSIFVEECRAIY